MVKTAGNTYEWTEHSLTVLGKGGFRVKADNTFNLLGGELPLGQAIAIFIDISQKPTYKSVVGGTLTRPVFTYSAAPLKRHFDHTKIIRTSGTGVQDVLIGGIYTGSVAKIYRFKIASMGTPDAFQYKTSTDGGATFTQHELGQHYLMTGARQPLTDGLTIYFANTTGHTANDEWEFSTAMPQLVEPAIQTAGTLETLAAAINTKTTLLNGAVAASTSGTTGFTITVDGSHGIVVNDVIAVEDEQMFVTGVSTNDLTVTRGYNSTAAPAHVDNSSAVGLVTASHRQVFVVKIMAGSSGKFVYSTDGGVTFDNGGGSVEAAADDGDGYLTIPDDFTHVLRDSDNVSYGIKVTFTGITDYSNNDAFSFHAFPTTKSNRYTPSSSKTLIAWVENTGEARTKHVFMSNAQLADTDSLNLPAAVAISDTGITFGGQDLSQSTVASGTDNQYSAFNSYFHFSDTNNVDLGGLAGQKTSVTNNYAPWVAGVRGNDNTDYAHYIFDRGSTIDHPILDMNVGMINNLRSLSQSVHTQGDYGEQMATIPGAITTATTLAYTKVANNGAAGDDGEMNVNQILALVPAGGNQWSNVKYDDVTELVKVTANDEVANNVTVIRGWNPGADPPAGDANLIKSFDAGAGLWRSWDDSATGGPIYAAMSGARQHVRIPPNNAYTSRTTQGTTSGWAYNADIELNGGGPHMLVLERNQVASTGLPDAPWNTQWRQQGATWGNIVVTGSTTVVPFKDDSILNDQLTLIGLSGVTVAGDNSVKAISFSLTPSSKRYKENIEKLTLDTSKLYNLIPRTFTWKEDAPVAEQGQSDFGLIAEEVAEIFPEITFNNARGQIEGVKYLTLSVLLLEELKKLKKRIEVLEGSN